MTASDAAETAQPVLRIVRGVPDGVDASLEIAVLTAVLAARGSAGTEPGPRVASAWNAPDRLLARSIHPSADGWRRSALPH
ncbi:MAG TPA: acyl-CoA carboxylase subunit epsilon [Mycobacteriales bacterium]